MLGFRRECTSRVTGGCLSTATARDEKDLSSVLFSKGTNTIHDDSTLTTYLLKAHLQIQLHWRLGFNIWILGGHQPSSSSVCFYDAPGFREHIWVLNVVFQLLRGDVSVPPPTFPSLFPFSVRTHCIDISASAGVALSVPGWWGRPGTRDPSWRDAGPHAQRCCPGLPDNKTNVFS